MLQTVELLAEIWKTSMERRLDGEMEQGQRINKNRKVGIQTSLSGHSQNISGETACLSRGFVRCAPREHDKCTNAQSHKPGFWKDPTN